jgi:hypothetical protein
MWIHLNLSVRTYKDRHLVKRYFHMVIPASALQPLTCQEVDPLSLWQVDVPVIVRTHDRTHQELIAKVILIIDMPYLSVMGMMEEQCLYNGQSAPAGMF